VEGNFECFLTDAKRQPNAGQKLFSKGTTCMFCCHCCL